MKKRWITRMLSIVLVLGLLSAPAFAAESSNCPSCGALYDNGFCTGCSGYQAPELVDGVYQIANAGQLYWFAALVNDGVDGMEKNIGANAVLTADIFVNTGDVTNCGGVKQDGWMDWTPIAYGNSRKFSGTFDGQGHTVSGLYCKTTTNYAGLFGNVYDGSVCNVGVVNSYIQGGTFVGGVCGRIYNSGSDTVLTISNCYNTGTVKGTTDSVGGVFGCVQNAGSAAVITVTNCRNSGNVYLTGTSTSGNAGGVCGYVNNTGASAAVTLTKCYNTGSVNAAGSSSKRIGGVCGRCDKATISNCYNTGAVAANGTRSTDVGGVCGYLYATGSTSAKVINCYSIGTPGTPKNSSSNLGGVCGNASAANCTVDNCYFLDTTAGKGIGSGSGTTASKTAAQFASGEVAYLLNGDSSGETNENPLIWHQNIDLGTPDAYPKFSGGTAYKTAAESPCQGYTNNSEGIKQHKFADSVCTWCGAQGHFITVTGIIAKDKPYDGTITAVLDCSGITLNGVQEGDEVSVVAVGVFSDADVGTNKTVTITGLTLTGADASKYCLADSGNQTETTASIYNTYTPARETDYTVNSGDWQNTDFVVTAQTGRELSAANLAEGEWSSTLSITEEGEGTLTFYVRNTETGAISLAVSETCKIDKTAPETWDITYQESSVKQALDSIAFSLFFGGDVNGKITASDSLSGIASVEYYRSETVLTQQEVAAITGWTEGSSFTVTAVDSEKFITYVRVTDKAGNIICFGSQGAQFDLTLPKITGVTDGEIRCTTRIVTVSDDNLDTVTLNGEAVTDTTITLPGNVDKTYTIAVTDKAGNNTTVTVTMKPISHLSKPIDGLNTGNVRSGHAQTIAAVKDAVAAQDITNATDAEKEALKAITDKAAELAAVIEDTQEEIRRINTALGKVGESSVNSDDTKDLADLTEDIQALLDTDNLTDGERKTLSDAKTEAEDLLRKVAEAAEAANTTGIQKVQDITSANVKPENKKDLEEAKKDLNDALEKYSGNYTGDEKKAITDAVKRIEDALNVIAKVESVENQINALPDTVSKSDTGKVNDAENAYNALSDYEKSLIDPAVKAKLDAAILAAAEANKPADPDSPQTGDSTNLWLWAGLMLVAAAGLAGAQGYRRKTK
ncbi:MAG: YDG domain-containing protein [Faecousia sp.]